MKVSKMCRNHWLAMPNNDHMMKPDKRYPPSIA
ncbi:Uncharacterised protein [Pseudomonas aeruginosa]|nr:Uncharacterised protein [Pseudomonas aeruginosa]